MPANPIPGPYTLPTTYTYHQDKPAEYSRIVNVTGSLNNPLTLTGSYANNAGFMVMNTASVFITGSDGSRFVGADFHTANNNHTIYPIAINYVSCSAGGQMVVLYKS
jgi:hypothetical protein